MFGEVEPKTSTKRTENYQFLFTPSMSASKHGRLQQQQESILLVSIMVPLQPQATISICMGEVMDQGIMIPSTSWTLIPWSGPSYPVDP